VSDQDWWDQLEALDLPSETRDTLLSLLKTRHPSAPSRPLDASPAQHTITLPMPGDDAAPAQTAPTDPALHFGRYRPLRVLGVGGMGEVWRVLDPELNRTMALKVLHPHHAPEPSHVARFLEEAQVTAQLQHPGIVPVHELGQLPDGRLYFTMQEVRGRTLREVIEAAHARPLDAAALHSLVATFQRACQAVAYAHDRAVVHRDLKPGNIMVGERGEVLVVDWGLARLLGVPERSAPAAARGVAAEPIVSDRSDAFATRHGTIAGTPAYMPPEQARGELERLGPHSDVYALGAVLYALLTGAAPFEGESLGALLKRVLAGERRPWPADHRLPEELVQICDQALSPDPAARQTDAGALESEIAAWLEGARKRQRALALVQQAARLEARAGDRRKQAARLREEIAVSLQELEGYEHWPEMRAPIWDAQDRVAALEREIAHLQAQRLEALSAALTHAPELPGANAALVEHYLDLHRAAEQARDPAAADAALAPLERHTEALPGDHPARRRAREYLRGEGALSLETNPPGARVTLYRYRLRRRRLVPEAARELGETPLSGVPLPSGSYLLTLSAEGCETAKLPLLVERGETADVAAPGATAAGLVYLLGEGSVSAEVCYVPAGWFISGGDPEALRGLPRRRDWTPGFLIQRFPVTHRDYLGFLNALIEGGEAERALSLAPQHPPARRDESGAQIYLRDADGRMFLDTEQAEYHKPLSLDQPVTLVSWLAAREYAGWYSRRTGRRWRLPDEIEWEKAARGADGRAFPWGDALDPAFCCIDDGVIYTPRVESVRSYPLDESPFGVRGMAGNVRDWCADPYREQGWLNHLRAHPEAATDEPTGGRRVSRGGSWSQPGRGARCASRFANEEERGHEDVGLRLVCDVGLHLSTSFLRSPADAERWLRYLGTR
jgi:formylglycine-generating enzyme required for sulfatase activity